MAPIVGTSANRALVVVVALVLAALLALGLLADGADAWIRRHPRLDGGGPWSTLVYDVDGLDGQGPLHMGRPPAPRRSAAAPVGHGKRHDARRRDRRGRTMATETRDTEARTTATMGDHASLVPRLLCSLVGHRWVWEGQPGAADWRRRCLRCDRGRPAWRRDGSPHPAATVRVDHQANRDGSNLAHLRDDISA